MLDAGEARWGPLEGPEAGHGRLVIRWAPDQDPWETLHGLNIVVAPSSGDETAVESTVPSVAIGAWLAVESAGDLESEPAGWLAGTFEPWSGEESPDAGPHVLPWEELAAALAAGGMWWIAQAPTAGQGAEHATPEGHGPKGDAGDQGHGDPGQPGGELPVEGDPGGGLATMSYGGGGYGGGGYGGGGYGGGGNQPPVAVADLAYSGKIGQPVTIYVLQNDFDPDGPRPTVTAVTQPAHGTAQVALGGGAVSYTAPASVFESDSFQYTVIDSYGATASATVSVTLVQAGGYTVEWLDPDDAWAALTEDWCDVEDQLRWTAEPLPTGSPTVSRIDFVKKPWDERDDPTLPWQAFATNEAGDGPAFGNPGLDEWAVMPQFHFYSEVLPNQSSFCAMAAAPGKQGVLTIESVEWKLHTDPPGAPQTGGELVPGSGLRFFPDAQSPGEQMRNKVDVEIKVLPKNRSGIVVDLRWFDVDDPSSDVAPVDDDPPENHRNNSDNRETNWNPEVMWPPNTVAIENNGVGRGVFHIEWVQPGNNYRIGASVHRASGPAPTYLQRMWPLARHQESMFYDKNKNEKYDGPAQQEAIFQTRFKTVCMSPVLTVWRKLHVETDSMGEVEGNFRLNAAVYVDPLAGGQSEVFLGVPLPGEDMMRFENGTLTDARWLPFGILSNTLDTVVVLNWPDGTAPEEGLITLEDDDAQVMPEMPKTGLMEAAYGKAFILPVFDGGGDLANNKSNVQFVLNVMGEEGEGVAPQIKDPFESKDNLSDSYWISYVQAGYQADPAGDMDPDEEGPAQGAFLGFHNWGEWPWGSMVFLETTRDYAAFVGLSETQLEVLKQRVVAHEIAHGFTVEDRFGSAPSLMHRAPPADFDNAKYSQFNDDQLDWIRTWGRYIDGPPPP